MATIRASRETCGDVQLTTSDATVRICVSNHEGEYRFECHTYDDLVVRHAEQRTIALLLAAGVEFVTCALPAECSSSEMAIPFPTMT